MGGIVINCDRGNYMYQDIGLNEILSEMIPGSYYHNHCYLSCCVDVSHILSNEEAFDKIVT